jgi:hypothetical protein
VRLRPSAGRAAGSSARIGWARRPARLAAVLSGGIVLGLVATAGPAAGATTTVTISNAQLPACTATPICKELSAGGTAEVVDKDGDSFLRMATPTATSHSTVHNYALFGQKLSTLNTLKYSTLIETLSSNGNQLAPALNIEINPNRPGQTYSTLVWEPIYSDTPVQAGQRQTWTPSATSAPKGGWWATGYLTATDTLNPLGFKTYTASFADVKAALPDATIISVGPNEGTGSPGLVSQVDKLTVNDTVYDFENPVVANAIAQVSGTGQSTAALTPFAQPLKVKLTGRDGTVPAPGATVTYTVVGNGNPTYPAATFPGNSATATATTGPDGIATSPALTAGLIPGPVTVTATSGTLSTTFTLTVTPPAGPARADLSLTMTNVPATVAHGKSFTATVTVRNDSSFPTTQVKTAVTAPSGLRITAAPGGIATGSAAAFVAPTLAPGASLTYPVTFTADAGARGAKMITAVTNSAVTDPNMLNNLARPTVTIT